MIKKILLTVFIAVIATVTALALYYVSAPVNTEELVYETVKHSVIAENAYIVRDEEVYYAESSGTLYNNVRDGERIAADSVLAVIYHADIEPETLKALRTVDKKILNQIEKQQEFTNYRLDGTDTESKIAAIIQDIPNAAKKNNIAGIAEYKNAINDLRLGIQTSDEERLNSLYEEKTAIEESISSEKSEVRTGISGVFTTYTDGLEGLLNAKDVKTYDIAYLNSLPQPVSERLTAISVQKGSPICKVVNNHVWYLVMAVPSDELEIYKEGTQVQMELAGMGGGVPVKGTIYSVSEAEEDGKRLAVIKCSSYLEGAFSYRVTKAELIFESYSGYKVPIHAIRTDAQGKKYVLCRSGSKEYGCYCTVDYTNTDEEYVIINSTQNAENKLERMERIILGEK